MRQIHLLKHVSYFPRHLHYLTAFLALVRPDTKECLYQSWIRQNYSHELYIVTSAGQCLRWNIWEMDFKIAIQKTRDEENINKDQLYKTV